MSKNLLYSTITNKNNPRTPIVEFEYPDSSTREMKIRHLRVTYADGNYVKGYELDSKGKDVQFKIFSRNRLTRYGVSLVSF